MDIVPLMFVARGDTSLPTLTDPTKAQKGHLYVLNLDANDGHSVVSFRPVELIGRPTEVALHAHGLGRTENIIFVVNHAYGEGGERVERYRLEEHRAERTVLRYDGYVDFTENLNGVMNDVAPTSETDFYVTQYVPFADPLHGRDTSGWAETLRNIPVALRLPLTRIYHCRLPLGADQVNATDACKPVGPPAMMYNGITFDPVSSIVYALDLFNKRIIGFSILRDGGLEKILEVYTPHFGDNIEFDQRTRQIHMGGVHHATQCFEKYLHHLVDQYIADEGNSLPQGATRSGHKCASHFTKIDPSTGKVEVVYIHGGELLGAAASAVSNSRGTVVMGSFCDDGVLVCRPS